MRSARKIAAVAIVLALSACGGGGGGGGGSLPIAATPGNTAGAPGTTAATPTGPSGTSDAPAGTPGAAPGTPGTAANPSPVVPVDRIEVALATGDPSGLLPEDRATLLQRATSKAIQLRVRPQQILADIYNTKGQVPDLALSVGADTSTGLASGGITQAIPFIVADDGRGIAAVAELGAGRVLAYGANVLSWMAGTTREQQHLPLFTRAFNWVMTGQGDGSLPATIRFSQAGYNSGVVKSFVTRLGKQTQEISCDIASPTNTCWGDADLLVFGPGVTDSPALGELVRGYVKAGKAVIYMHGSWAPSAGGTRMLAALGMNLGGYPGNFFASAPSYSVNANRTAANSLARADQLGTLVQALQLLAKDKYTQDFTVDTTPIDGINLARNDLSSYETAGQKIFKAEDTELQRLLVLWADEWRPEVVYGKISRSGDAANFLRAYASDSWEAFSRTATTTNPSGQGDYMSAAAQKLAGSADYETIEVTLPQGSGMTAIGRGAIPARAVAVAIEEAPTGLNLGLQSSYIRTYGNPLKDNYSRPRQAPSWNVPLQRTIINDFVTPFGGPLFLSYSGATAGQKITLRVKGATKYAYFDFSQGTPSPEEQNEAMTALQAQSFGWATFKSRSGEVQQPIDVALKSFRDGLPAGTLRTPQDLVANRFQYILMDGNHIANGYNDMAMSATVSTLCTAFGWACDDAVHNAPGVQHFVSWLPACGSGCSGSPIDSDHWLMDIGWGWAHELGHNTVQRWMTIVPPNSPGCVVECDNNTLSSVNSMRRYAILGEDVGQWLDPASLYKDIQDNRATNLAGEALRADMETRLWGASKPQGAMRAMYFQLAFLYTKTRHNESQPTFDHTVEFFTLLSKGGRLVANKWTTATASSYGMGSYPNNTIPNYELQYVLGSKIIGQDLRNVFSMYGIPLSPTALNSVAALGLPTMPQQFYALSSSKANQLATGQWVSLQGQTPAYPF